MLDDIKDLIGREGLVVITLYAGLAWLAADPISHRVAQRQHLARCIADTGSSASPSEATAELDLAARALRDFGPLGEFGGALLDVERQRREAEARRRAVAIARAAPDACRCRIDLARAATRADWALWIGTLKLYRPSSIADFGSVIARADREGLCKRSAAS